MTKHLSPDERNKQILEAARICFLNKGYFATKMDEIAKTANLSKGGVYFHFESKRDIFRSLVDSDYQDMMGFLDGVVLGEGDLPTKLYRLGEHFMLLLSEPNRARMMIIVAEMSLRDDEIRQQILELHESYLNKVAQLLTASSGSNQLKDVDVKAVAFILKAIIDGIQASSVVGYRMDLQRVINAAVGMVTDGILQPAVNTALASTPPLDR